MVNSILFVTHNTHKLEEAQALLRGSSFDIASLKTIPELSAVDDIPETGTTFNQNARQKVDFVKEYSNLSLLADDSGLEVVALNGLPGVKSKRWIAGSDEDRNMYLLTQLKDVQDREARFVTVLCYFSVVSHRYHFFRGEVKGKIAHEAKGENGFGYDPLFIPDGYDKTFAELGAIVKNQLSHRAKAFEQLKMFLSEDHVDGDK